MRNLVLFCIFCLILFFTGCKIVSAKRDTEIAKDIQYMSGLYNSHRAFTKDEAEKVKEPKIIAADQIDSYKDLNKAIIYRLLGKEKGDALLAEKPEVTIKKEEK